MYRKFVDLDIVGGVFGVSPAEDSVGGGMKDILGVGADKIGSEGHVEGVLNRGVGGLRRGHGSTSLGSILSVRVHGVHSEVGIGTAHSEIGAHPLGPVTHVGQFIHDRVSKRRIAASFGNGQVDGAYDGRVDDSE